MRKTNSFEYPNLAGAEMLAVDTETTDPHLKEMGPGARRKDGRVIGVSLATPEGKSWYFPIAHKRGRNYPPQIWQYIKDTLALPMPKVGANLMYDRDWLDFHGVDVKGPFYDVQVAEPLLDEHRRYYNLESLGKSYMGEGKLENEMKEWTELHFGKNANPKKMMAEIPAEIVGRYAKQDALLPIQIIQKQLKKLEEQGLMELFKLETEFSEVLFMMRKQGCRIDIDKVEPVSEKYSGKIKVLQEKINKSAGFEVSVYNKDDTLVKFMNQLELQYPYTSKKAPSIKTAWLLNQENTICHDIAELIKLRKFHSTFVEGSIQTHVVGDRIYGNYHQLRSDDYGTVSGRLSASKPNLQNQVGRDPVLAKDLRSLFLPEEGELFVKADYKAIEPRLAIHAAVALNVHPSIYGVQEYLNNNPDADVYQPLMDQLPHMERGKIKGLQLGTTYGMGIDKTAVELGVTIAQAKLEREDFHKGVPWLKKLNDFAKNRASTIGHITTLLKRRCRFNLWEPRKQKFPNDFNQYSDYLKWKEDHPPLEHAAAVEAYGSVKRAYVYKALNGYCQGSSADIIKKSMVDLKRNGYYDEFSPPINTVHDENDFSVPKDPKRKREAYFAIRDTMCNTVKLHIPLLVDMEIGPNWGEVKYWEET